MTSRLRKPILLLATKILVMQAVLMPIGTVYAETTMDTEEQEQVELPTMKNYLEETSEEVPDEETESSDEDSVEPKDLKEENVIAKEETAEEEINESNTAIPTVTTSDLFVQLDSEGKPISNQHLIPNDVVFANNGYNLSANPQSEVRVNGSLITTTRTLRTGDVITFDYIGTDLHGGFLSAEWIITSVAGSASVSGAALLRGQSSTLEYEVTYFDSNGQVVDTPVWTNYSKNEAVRHTIALDQLLMVASANTSLRWNIASGVANFTGNSFGGTNPYNLVTKGRTTETLTFNAAGTGSLLLYRQTGPLLDIDYSRLSVVGQTVENNLVSKYTISQTIPGYTAGDFNFFVDSQDILKGNEARILSIVDDGGTNLESIISTNHSENRLSFSISEAELETLREKKINIELEYPIDKEKNVEDYLVGDQLEIGVKASNNRSGIVAEGTALTWARPWGEPVSQEVGINTSTSDLDPTKFVKNLENKLEGDEPFVVGFAEEKSFDVFGESSVSVVIESVISGVQNTIDVPINVVENTGSVFVHHVDKEGATLVPSDELIGVIGEAYETSPKSVDNYKVIDYPSNGTGLYEKDPINVIYVYDIAPVLPVDPLDPELEVDPEDKPDLPEDQGLLSIDFISSFNFGSQAISVHDQTYYAQPQRLLNEDGTVNESEERPNYVQISDRRPENDRNGWQLAVTQNDPFTATNNRELNGASLRLTNQQLATSQGGSAPEFQQTNPLALVPGNRRILLMAQGTEGTGTWIYRFGDQETANKSVALDVPKGTNPEDTRYETTLTWELSAVPDN
ncbi:hypothetical protein FDP51_14720 [Enterococcus mundtii]|uniref:WxL domain-containing protein n=1 Tax=Enterococcus mundtii TaxID=53346 RepID=UPI00129CED0C|nr:WxL domain-containing protein [Enterococcus mundtii]MRI75199.1 hypothetical protein [Enterococcus mundtii]